MPTIEEIETRLVNAEATTQTMLCTVAADLILLQAAVTALRQEGILTDRIVDRIGIDAQIRLQFFSTPELPPEGMPVIAAKIDALAERLRRAVPSKPLPQRPSGLKSTASGNGNGRVRAPRKALAG